MPDRDLTPVVRDLLDIPFHRTHDIQVVEVTPDHARLRIPFDESLVGNPEKPAVHGGVISALVDIAGAAPFLGTRGAYTPTIDLRVDYLGHAGEADLVGVARVERRGEDVGVSDVTVSAGEEVCASGTGVYKLSR